MALVLADRVRETTTVTGTGTATLLGAVSGYQSFSAVGNANTTYYVIANQSASEWEVGIGTYTSSGTTLSRDTVLSSSNSGSLVNFTAGTKDVFVDYPASKAVYEDASGNVAGYPITGGTIDNTVIGGTTPAAGTFTTLTATGQTSLGGAAGSESFRAYVASTSGSRFATQVNTNVYFGVDGTATPLIANTNGGIFSVRTSAIGGTGNEQLRVSHTASAVNYVQVTGAATGGAPYVLANGSDTNVPLVISSKGSSSILFKTAGTTPTQLEVSHTASAVNYVQVTGAATGNDPTYSAQGSDTNVSLRYLSKGAGEHRFATNTSSNIQFRVLHGGSSVVNYFQTYGSATGFGPVLAAAGSDTNIPAVVQPKGTGALQAQQTDSTATGGNARGANAVDWQTNRSSASQVASSLGSVLAGGLSGTASGAASFLGSGQTNLVSSTYAVCVGGIGNNSTGNSAFLGGGGSNIASGYYGFVGSGAGNSTTSNSAVTTQSATMNGTTAVTLSGSNASIKVGQLITGTSITGFPATYVAAVSGTSLTLSQAASGSSTSTLSFYTPHGVVVGGGNNQATGSYSFIGGGGDAGTAANRNVASGDWGTIAGGRNNTASGVASFVGGGGFTGVDAGGNTASGTCATVSGGFGNTASGTGSSVTGGFQNTANSTVSIAVGGRRATTRSIIGNTVFSGCENPIADAQGASQSSLLVLARQTTDATATVLTSNASAAGTTNQVILPNNSAYYFKGSVIANVTGGGNTKGWTIEGAIKRGANAASTALVGTPTVTSSYADAGASTWAITATADTTNGGLAITFTGQAGTTIRVVAKLETVEVTF